MVALLDAVPHHRRVPGQGVGLQEVPRVEVVELQSNVMWRGHYSTEVTAGGHSSEVTALSGHGHLSELWPLQPRSWRREGGSSGDYAEQRQRPPYPGQTIQTCQQCLTMFGRMEN